MVRNWSGRVPEKNTDTRILGLTRLMAGYEVAPANSMDPIARAERRSWTCLWTLQARYECYLVGVGGRANLGLWDGYREPRGTGVCAGGYNMYSYSCSYLLPWRGVSMEDSNLTS